MLCPGRVDREPCTHPGSARFQRVGVRPAVREGAAELAAALLAAGTDHTGAG